MSSGFPLVRASDVTPIFRWLRDNNAPIGEALETISSPVAPWEEPDRPIPLLGEFAILRSLSAQKGPDIACRVVSQESILELGTLSAVLFGERTPRDALTRLCEAIDRHGSHEQFMLVPAPGGIIIREQIGLDLDAETRHNIQQYVAALLRSLFLMTGFNGQPLTRMEMTPHPQFGLDHIKNIFGSPPIASSSERLSIFVMNDVLDRPFLTQFRRARTVNPPGDWIQLRGMPLKQSASFFIATLFELGPEEPNITQFAAASGLSLRSIQRKLAEENTSFSILVDEFRRTRGLAALRDSSAPIGSIAADLGYSGQQAFVRAVRRWTGVPPGEYRKFLSTSSSCRKAGGCSGGEVSADRTEGSRSEPSAASLRPGPKRDGDLGGT